MIKYAPSQKLVTRHEMGSYSYRKGSGQAWHSVCVCVVVVGFFLFFSFLFDLRQLPSSPSRIVGPKKKDSSGFLKRGYDEECSNGTRAGVISRV